MVQHRPISDRIESTLPRVADETTPTELRHSPEVNGIDRAAIRQPGQVCMQLVSATQTDAPTIFVATSREVAAAVDRIAVQPIKETTPTGAKPYRVPEPLSVDADRMVVQDTDMEQPAVELVAGDGARLTWSQTSVTLPSDDDQPELPDGVCFAREEDGQWIIEPTNGSPTQTVTSREELDESYATVNDWVTPTQAGYQNAIRLCYADNWNKLQVCEYEPPTTVASQASSDTLREFFDQTTVKSSDSVLEFDRVLKEYEAWLGAGPINQNVFAELLQSTDCETAKQAIGTGQQTVIQGRAWRYLSLTRDTAHGSPHC